MFLNHLPSKLIIPFLYMAYTLIAVDGTITEEENDSFALYAIELHLKSMPECKVIDYDRVLPYFEELSNSIKKEIYFELVSLAYADSNYEEREKALLKKVSIAFHISEDECDKIEKIVSSLINEYVKLGELINA